MDGTVSAWNIMGRRPTSEDLYCMLAVFVQCLLPRTNSGCHETNQSSDNPPPPKKNPTTCTQDPPEVIQVGVISLPWRNELHP